MYREMHIWCCNIKNYEIKYSQNKRYDRFQIDGQAFTSSYMNGKEKEIRRLQYLLSKRILLYNSEYLAVGIFSIVTRLV